MVIESAVALLAACLDSTTPITPFIRPTRRSRAGLTVSNAAVVERSWPALLPFLFGCQDVVTV